MLLVLVASGSGFGQNRTIEFSKATWKKHLNQARKENKLIFLDAQTKWCGFCRIMEKYIFTADSVADFYNRNFINVSMDMEEGEGIELRKKYGLYAYPSLLFINSDGELVDCKIGACSTYLDFIELGKRALDPERNYAGLKRKYEAGDRSLEVLQAYLRVLLDSGKDGTREKILTEDLGSLDDSIFFTERVWQIILENRAETTPLLMKRVMKNKDPFLNIAGKQVVDSVLDAAFFSRVENLCRMADKKQFKKEECIRMIQLLKDADLPFRGEYLAFLYAALELNRNNNMGAVQVVADVMKYQLFRMGTCDIFYTMVLNTVADCDDPEVKSRGSRLMEGLKGEDGFPAYYRSLYEKIYNRMSKSDEMIE